jgi:hypothetical protein
MSAATKIEPRDLDGLRYLEELGGAHLLLKTIQPTTFEAKGAAGWEEIKEYFRSHAHDGARAIVLLEIDLPQRVGKVGRVVLIGEEHENNNRCPPHLSNAKDIVTDGTLSFLCGNTDCVLIAEIFFYLMGESIDTPDPIGLMMKHNYPLRAAVDCPPNEAERGCIYQNRSSALKHIRMFSSIVRHVASHLDDIGKTGTYIQELSRRIVAFDPREDLQMTPPQETLADEDIRKSCDNALKGISRFVPSLTDDWMHRAFHKAVYSPILEMLRQVNEHPSIGGYAEAFVRVTEVVSISRGLAMWDHALHHRHDMELPILIFYAGDTHRAQIQEYMEAMGLPVRVIQSHYDSGSCAT